MRAMIFAMLILAWGSLTVSVGPGPNERVPALAALLLGSFMGVEPHGSDRLKMPYSYCTACARGAGCRTWLGSAYNDVGAFPYVCVRSNDDRRVRVATG